MRGALQADRGPGGGRERHGWQGARTTCSGSPANGRRIRAGGRASPDREMAGSGTWERAGDGVPPRWERGRRDIRRAKATRRGGAKGPEAGDRRRRDAWRAHRGSGHAAVVAVARREPRPACAAPAPGAGARRCTRARKTAAAARSCGEARRPCPRAPCASCHAASETPCSGTSLSFRLSARTTLSGKSLLLPWNWSGYASVRVGSSGSRRMSKRCPPLPRLSSSHPPKCRTFRTMSRRFVGIAPRAYATPARTCSLRSTRCGSGTRKVPTT